MSIHHGEELALKVEDGMPCSIVSDNGYIVAPLVMKSQGKRIVACWNACAGIDNEYLNSGDNLATYARRMAVDNEYLHKQLSEAQEALAAANREKAMLELQLKQASDNTIALCDKLEALRKDVAFAKSVEAEMNGLRSNINRLKERLKKLRAGIELNLQADSELEQSNHEIRSK